MWTSENKHVPVKIDAYRRKRACVVKVKPHESKNQREWVQMNANKWNEHVPVENEN